jgi:hypothetical protein
MRKADRETIRKYPADVSFEWLISGSSFYYVVLSPVVRISGEIAPESFTLETARMEYQNAATPWLELRLDGDDQHAVIEFIRELLKQE